MINQLVKKIEELKAPIVVGLDPMLDYVPEQIKEKAFSEYGETLEGAGEAMWQFNKGILDTTSDLIPAVKPQIAIISCAENNRYGHPHKEVLERLREAGAEVLRTDESGAIIIKVSGEKVKISEMLAP